MKCHPFASKFPIPEGAEWDTFVVSIKATRGNKDNPILYRMVDGQPQLLDGRCREKACKQLGIKPTYKRVQVADEEVVPFIIRQNITRRHLTPELRRQLVAELRSAGGSERQIAGTLNISPATAHRDIVATRQRSPASNEAPAAVTGRDGKSYPAIRPQNIGDAHEGPILCDRCQRVGAVNDCAKCKEARQKAAQAANRKGTRVGPQKNGQQFFDWKSFGHDFGAIYRQVCKLGKLYGAKESHEAERLRDKLGEFKDDFEAWYKALTKMGVPRY
jgi:transposase-like protein